MVDDSDLTDFFRAYDANGNGALDYKEFTDIVFGKARIQNPSTTASQCSQQSRNGLEFSTPKGGDMTYRGIKE